MGYIFSRTGAGSKRNTLERTNLRRIFFGTLFTALVVFGALLFMKQSEAGKESEGIVTVAAVYAVVSAAFSCFAFRLLQKKSKASELWLFQMSYLIINTSFLTYLSYAVLMYTGSLMLYFFTVILSSCLLLCRKGEYALCAGMELLLPVVLLLEKSLSPEQCAGIAAVHLLAAFIAFELYGGYRLADEYRRKYCLEVKASEEDPLTGLKNRRGMARQVTSVWPLCERMNRKAAVLVIDIDQFKKYNDRFGHPRGDSCLLQVARTIRATVNRKSDLVARIGGEEFLVFLYGAEEEGACFLAEKIRRNIEELQIPHAPEAKYNYVTVSIGVAMERCGKDVSFSGLYRRADKELYYAKNAGRNQVAFHRNGFMPQTGQKAGTR